MGQFAFVVSPVSPDDPCGPDLEGESDFENTLASLEGRFPGSYLKFVNSRGQDNGEFSELAAGFDLAVELAPLIDLLKRSRDIRLLIPAARLAALSGRFELFSEIVTGVAALVIDHWDEVHPRAVDGSFVIRETHLSNLAHNTNIVMPLQEQPFITVRRAGPVSFRMFQLATKAVPPREGETIPDEAALRDALLKSDDFPDIKALRSQLEAALEALKQIRAKFGEKVGLQGAPDFEKLNAPLAKFTALLNGIIEEREPSAPPPSLPGDEAEGGTAADATAGTDAAAASAAAKGPVQSAAGVAAALKAAEAYYQRNEPSNPATLLVRQAHKLVGKSFIEAMTVLNPELAEKASIRIGGDVQLIVTSEQMTALAQERSEEEQEAAAPEFPAIATRGEALAVLDAVERYYQRNEASSPISLLLSRARSYSGKDFATLMREVVPKDEE